MSQAHGEHMSIILQRKNTSISNAVFRIPSDIESTANDAAKNCDEEKNSSRIVPPTAGGGGVDIPRRHPLDPYIAPKLVPPPLFFVGWLVLNW